MRIRSKLGERLQITYRHMGTVLVIFKNCGDRPAICRLPKEAGGEQSELTQ